MSSRIAIVRKLFRHLREQNKAGLIPIVGVLLLLSAVLGFLHLVSPIAPFVYSLF